MTLRNKPGLQGRCSHGPMKTYRENGCERHVVVDTAIGASPQSQADKPHAGNPELVVRRGQVLQMPQLLGGHQP